MKMSHGVVRASSALILAIGMTLGVGMIGAVTGAAAVTGGGVIQIQALVDGRSQLILQGDTAQWHHFDFAAPGRELFANEPTIVNGTDWFPQWPDVPNAENRDCNCFSDVLTGVDPPVPQTDLTVTLTLVEARGPVSIVQAPSSGNGYTLVVQFDDNAFGGAVPYIVNINLGVGTGDRLSLGLYEGTQGAKTLAYANVGSLTSGDIDVSPLVGRPTSVNGTGTLPSPSGNGDATIAFALSFSGATKTWSGTLIVNDPGAAFSASIPIHAGSREIARSGTTIHGVLWSIKAQSVPQKCFKILFAIDDLA
ncbi:MAG: hypothetical protein ACXVEI_12290 [Actinomycetota bacterium]